MQTPKQVIVNPPDTVLLNQEDKKAVVTDMTVAFRRKHQEKLEKNQDQRAAGVYVGTRNSALCLSLLTVVYSTLFMYV